MLDMNENYAKGQCKILRQEEVSFSLPGLFASLFCMFFFMSSIVDWVEEGLLVV